MTNAMIKVLLDCCFMAKKVTETIPKLPEGIKPRHIHVLASVAERSANGSTVRVNDVCTDLSVTMPSITKLINDMVKLSIIVKSSLPNDKRATALSLTELGKQYYETYVLEYHGKLSEKLAELDEGNCMATAETIRRLYAAVCSLKGENYDEK